MADGSSDANDKENVNQNQTQLGNINISPQDQQFIKQNIFEAL